MQICDLALSLARLLMILGTLFADPYCYTEDLLPKSEIVDTTQQTLERPISLSLTQTSLVDAIEQLRRQSDAIIVIDPQLIAKPPLISLHCKRLRLRSALEWICQSAHAYAELRQGQIWVSPGDAILLQPGSSRVVSPPPGPDAIKKLLNDPITLGLNNTPLVEALNLLSEKTTLAVVLDPSLITVLRPVTLRVERMSLRFVLDFTCKDGEIQYAIKDRRSGVPESSWSYTSILGPSIPPAQSILE